MTEIFFAFGDINPK